MAQEVPPYQRLSPDSQPWGRWVTDKIQKNEVAQDSALTNLQAQNKSLAAQLNRLQDSIGDLRARRTYSKMVSGVLSSSVNSAYVNYSGADSIDFTLLRRSLVRISGSALVSASLAGAGPLASAGFGVYLDTIPTVWPNPESSRLSSGASQSPASSYSASLVFGTTLEIDSGAHFVRPLPAATYVQFTGATGGVITLENMFFSVDILGFA